MNLTAVGAIYSLAETAVTSLLTGSSLLCTDNGVWLRFSNDFVGNTSSSFN